MLFIILPVLGSAGCVTRCKSDAKLAVRVSTLLVSQPTIGGLHQYWWISTILVNYNNIGGFQQYWWVSTILVFFQYWCYKANKILQNSAILSVQCFWPNITTILQRLLYTLVWLILVKYLVKGRIHWYQSRTFFSLYSQNIDL